MERSYAAFILSAEKLFDEEKRVYFWTFTMVDVYPDWCYSRIWERFIRDIRDLYGGLLKGLKVVELHHEHGIHWHALLNQRVWVGEVRRIGRCYGVGRIHVKKANRSAIDYLAKYVTKDFKHKNKTFSRMSRWGTVGGFVGVKVCNLVGESPYHERIEWSKPVLRQDKIPYALCSLLGCMLGATQNQVEQVSGCFRLSGYWDSVKVVMSMGYDVGERLFNGYKTNGSQGNNRIHSKDG